MRTRGGGACDAQVLSLVVRPNGERLGGGGSLSAFSRLLLPSRVIHLRGPGWDCKREVNQFIIVLAVLIHGINLMNATWFTGKVKRSSPGFFYVEGPLHFVFCTAHKRETKRRGGTFPAATCPSNPTRLTAIHNPPTPPRNSYSLIGGGECKRANGSFPRN